MKLLLPLLFALLAPAMQKPAAEDADLDRAIGEAGSSPIEYSRALERHLRKYPDTKKRPEIENVLLRAAIELKDKQRILRYGVPVIEAGSRNALFLDHVSRALLDSTVPEDGEKALKYTRLLEEQLQSNLREVQAEVSGPGRGRRLDETEYAIARTLAFQARALGGLGRVDEAVARAREAFALCPTAEGAREISRWLERKGDLKGALDAAADAFTVNDSRAAAADKPSDRKRVADLAARLGTPDAAGERVLAAFDRNLALTDARRARILAFDPNAGADEPLKFTLSGPGDRKLPLSSLKGKVIVFDFWATWCGPCRAQHPLYQQVMQRFKTRPEVIFLAVSTDEQRENVVPFLESNKWSKEVWFDDGIGSFLRINSIPTTVVVDRNGAVSSRLNGFIADRFVDMLTERINEALTDAVPSMAAR